MRALFFDTETTGLPKDAGKEASHGPNNWPEVVSIAWIITNGSTPVAGKYFIIKPNGWKIPEESVKFHGITEEMAHAEGAPLQHVMGEFMRDLRQVDIIIAHNMSFDKNVILSAILYGCKDDIAIKWPLREFCTCEGARETTRLPLSNPSQKYKFKKPKLTELYEHAFKSLPPANILHTSLGDTQILVALFFKIWTLEMVSTNVKA